MTPQYLNELADLADPEGLWKLSGADQLYLPPDKRKQLDTAVALRRYAAHLTTLAGALERKESVLITPLSSCGQATMLVETPPRHRKLRRTNGL
jgi:hypothetical protein